jgi:hypothetical protein
LDKKDHLWMRIGEKSKPDFHKFTSQTVSRVRIHHAQHSERKSTLHRIVRKFSAHS